MVNFAWLTIELVLTFIAPGLLCILSIIWLSSIIFNLYLLEILLRSGLGFLGGVIFFVFALIFGYIIDMIGHFSFDKAEDTFAKRLFSDKHLDEHLGIPEEEKLYDKIIGLFDKGASERIYARRSQTYLYYESARNISIVWWLFVPSFSLYIVVKQGNYFGFFFLLALLLQIVMFWYRWKMLEYFYSYYIRFVLLSEKKNRKE